MESQHTEKFTSVGTDIEEVKRQNAESGLTYNEVKEILAKTIAQDTADRERQQGNNRSF